MSYFQLPLWQQLTLLWAGAVLLAGALLWADSRAPAQFFWFLTYPPSVRELRKAVAAYFRACPLLACGTLLVPALAALGTVLLLVVRVVEIARGSPAGG